MARCWPFCGPKCAICWIVVSSWGILMLGLLGVFFYLNSASMLDNLNVDTTAIAGGGLNITEIHKEFRQQALNCWIATGAYVATLVFSIWQAKINFK